MHVIFRGGVRGNEGDAGLIIALIYLFAGIVGIALRKSKSGSIAAGIFYLITAVIGFANFAAFSFWAILALIFGVVFIVGGIMTKKTD